MSLVGHVYHVTNASEAFVPVVLGDTHPTSGFVPWPGVTVIAQYWAELVPGFPLLPFFVTTATVARDGSFELLEPTVKFAGEMVSLLVTSGVPYYRSEYISLSGARSKELNLWLYVDTLPTSDGISAGTISQQVAGQGLPSNTTITAGGLYGLHFYGTDGQVGMNFNLWIAADTSPNLNSFLDLSINGYSINVDWPTSIVESADDVLNKIKSGIAGAGSSVNQAVLKRMEGILDSQEHLTASLASTFLSNVSVTFYGIGYPNAHLGNRKHL